METVLIQIKNEKAYRLLEDLEELQILKVLKKNNPSSQKLSEKYAGKIPAEIAENLQNQLTKSREEWNGRNI
jgi:hypothetical protein